MDKTTKGHFITYTPRGIRKYLIIYNLFSEVKKGDFEPHKKVICEDSLDAFLKSEEIQDDDVINLSIFEKVEIDFITED